MPTDLTARREKLEREFLEDPFADDVSAKLVALYAFDDPAKAQYILSISATLHAIALYHQLTKATPKHIFGRILDRLSSTLDLLLGLSSQYQFPQLFEAILEIGPEQLPRQITLQCVESLLTEMRHALVHIGRSKEDKWYRQFADLLPGSVTKSWGSLPDYYRVSSFRTDVSGDACMVLGAGASKSSGMPLVSEVFQPAFVEKLLSGFAQWVVPPNLIEETKRFAQYGSSPDEIYAQIRGEEARERQFFDHIETVFEYSQIAAEQKNDYIGNIERLLALDCRTFISLNTDLLLDQALWFYSHDDEDVLRNFGRSYPWATSDNPLCATYNYGLTFDTAREEATYANIEMLIVNDFTRTFDMLPYGEKINLFKLHGSFNWVVCQACELLSYFGDSPIVQTEKARECPRCGKPEFRPFYIPPYRQRKSGHFNILFEACRESLENAATIYVVGYSFPEYDADMFALFGALTDKRIVVVDPFPNPRMQAFLSGLTRCDVQFIQKPFLEWMQEL